MAVDTKFPNGMIVKQLKEQLEGIDDSLLVVLSIDEEGNSFKPVYEVGAENNVYNEEDWDIGLKHLTPELENKGYTEEDIQEGRDCIVIWPIG